MLLRIIIIDGRGLLNLDNMLWIFCIIKVQDKKLRVKDGFPNESVELFPLFTLFDWITNTLAEDLSHVNFVNTCLSSCKSKELLELLYSLLHLELALGSTNE